LKTKVLLSLLLLAPVCAPRAAEPKPAAQATAWVRYTYPGEEFSVELPAMPSVLHTSRVIKSTPYDADGMRVFGLYSRGVIFMLVSFDRPRALETDDRFASYISDVRDLTPSGEKRLGDVTGREYEIGMSFKGKARIFRTESHAYLLKAFSDAEGYGETVERFLNSFTLGSKPTGALITGDVPVQPYVLPKVTAAPATAGSGVGSGRGIGTGGTAAAQGISEEALKLARGRGGAAAGDVPYKGVDVSRKAVLVYKPQPGYTEEARTNDISGVVRLRVVLSPSGNVTNISVVKGLPDGLTEKAIVAARHIRFFPAIKDGQEVPQYAVLEYNFNIY
jgi:TonB family protein